MRITAGRNAYRKGKGVIGAYQVNVKEMCSARVCVSSAYMNALETMALTEKQQEKVQVCEGKNNSVSIMLGVKTADKEKLMT